MLVGERYQNIRILHLEIFYMHMPKHKTLDVPTILINIRIKIMSMILRSLHVYFSFTHYILHSLYITLNIYQLIRMLSFLWQCLLDLTKFVH